MKMNSKNSFKNIEDFFEAPPTPRQKAWGLVNKFYHLILTNMEEKGISRTQLAKKLNRSKSSVSHMFNKTPNISVLKMVEIADAIGFNLDIVDLEKQKKLEQQKEKGQRVVVVYSHLKIEDSGIASQQFSHSDDTSHFHYKKQIRLDKHYGTQEK
jgi:ribosome-binding protein aMBF1 (putative translation factor)